jgi:protein involved in polysaccharide export with SLBB domain
MTPILSHGNKRETSKIITFLFGIIVMLCSGQAHSDGHDTILSPPVLASPPNGANELPASLGLNWSTVAGAASYEVEVSSSSAFDATFFDQSGTALTSAALNDLANGTTYYWRANTSSNGRTSAWATAASFTTGGIVSTRFLSNEQLQFQYGDAVEIVAFPDSGKLLSGTYFIDHDGYADLPLIGMTSVIHRTPTEVEQYLMTQYKVFLPRQNIIVRVMFRASLLGGFLKPGIYWVNPRGSLWDVLQQGGGTVREDGIKKVHWIHVDSGKIVNRDILPYLQSDQSLLSIGFKSGDQLTVTTIPKQGTWELFRDGILPVLSLTASLFVSYEVYFYYKKMN